MKAAPAPPTRWWRGTPVADRRAVVWLVALPTALFVIPALAGHPAIVADNLIQNFPLRALAGRQLAGGHLPLLNPYADSGTPLLGGLNAGALYPTTLLFLAGWPVAAWVADLVVVFAGAALGVYALARWHGFRVRASFLAAVSYTFFGAMVGQIVHLGVVQGYSLLPWAVLALVALSRRLQRAGDEWRDLALAARAPVLGLALLWGLACLSGEPRSISEIELLTLVGAPGILLLRSSYWLATWRARVVYLSGVALGAAWGVAIGLVQLLPGWAFIGFSQRSSVSYWFFGSGSLPVRWSSLLFVQDLVGSNSLLGTPRYFVGYNLPEVTGYAGIVALMALFAFVSRVTRRGWVGGCRDVTLYLVVAFVGLWATWGTFTPVGHLFHAIPLFSSTRLPSRNAILIDLAAAMLLAWWVDRLEAGALDEAGLTGRRRFVTLTPAYVVVGLCVAMLVAGPSFVDWLARGTANPGLARHEVLTLLLHVGVALAAIAVVVGWRRWTRPLRWLTGVLGVDLAVFLVFCSTGLVGGNVIIPSAAHARAVLGDQGRTALVTVVGQNGPQFEALGEANMNVFTGLPSVQGYGSLISSIYNRSTGTHPQEQVDPCALVAGTFAQLRLATVVLAANELLSAPGATYRAAPACLRQRPATVTSRYFGRVLAVSEVELNGRAGAAFARGPFTVQLLGADGRPIKTLKPLKSSFPAEVHSAGYVFGPVRAAGLRVSGTHVALGDVRVTTAGPGSTSYQLDGPFEIAMSSPRWRLASTPGAHSVFRATRVSAPDWLVDATAGQRVTHVRDAAWGDSWVSVNAPRPVVLVRSMAFLPGWRATARNAATGASVNLPVTRHGLIQEVRVPSGRWVVHFHYHAPHIELGLVGSGVTSLLWLAGVGWMLTSRRRRATTSIRS
ncbi:MAG: hypothetical protein ACHQFZ_09865 [Acidimicrobiales bacterium]